MTLPYEQYNSIVNVRNFLLSLMDAKQTPKIPKHYRENARRLLKHFPNEYEANDLIQKHTELLHEISIRKVAKKRDSIEYSPRHGGWIFWDCTDTEPSKAFMTRSDAEDAFADYVKSIQ